MQPRNVLNKYQCERPRFYLKFLRITKNSENKIIFDTFLSANIRKLYQLPLQWGNNNYFYNHLWGLFCAGNFKYILS